MTTHEFSPFFQVRCTVLQFYMSKRLLEVSMPMTQLKINHTLANCRDHLILLADNTAPPLTCVLPEVTGHPLNGSDRIQAVPGTCARRSYSQQFDVDR